MLRSHLVDVARLRAEFQALYSAESQVFSAPGRVNLIGEHTDYNEGFVLPMAIERRTYVAGAPNQTSQIRVKSLTLGESFDFDLERPGPKRRGSWLDYVEGTARALLDRGIPVVGCDLLIDSDVPTGAGVSASAALELSVGIALALLGGTAEPDRVQLALAGQAAEHQYVGTMCGIMDQYIAAMGRENAALLIDCRSLETQTVPLELGAVSVLVCDTRVKHELSSSEYNLRRAECLRASNILAKSIPGVRTLRDVSVADFEQFATQLPGVVRSRCRHVVTENARTLAAADAMRGGDLVTMGRLMSESHVSLRDDYQVSCEELDVAVDIASSQPGVYGSRMTGGGFGGCTVTLVDNDAAPRVSRAVKEAFAARGWKEPELFSSRACEGARREA
ncbi:MAG TPA: galactokinase [Polyangiaceae bacterium]|nr:galactokinase [Polyangiaceae bacterium]